MSVHKLFVFSLVAPVLITGHDRGRLLDYLTDRFVVLHWDPKCAAGDFNHLEFVVARFHHIIK